MKALLTLRLLLGLALFAAANRPAPANAAPAGKTFTVNAAVDALDQTPGNGVCETGAGNGVCTLRAAIMEANASVGADTIAVPADTFTLTIPGIDEDQAHTGDLDLTSNVTILGAGAANTIIQWGPFTPTDNRDRVFDIQASATVSISGVAIRHGYVSNQPSGGGVLILGGALTISDSLLANNWASNGIGGAVENFDGTLSIYNSVLTGNHATEGGAVFSFGALTVTDSLLHDNSAVDFGGAVHVYAGTAWLSGNTISENRSGRGGGMFNDGTTTVTSSTISGNTAYYFSGGGIYSAGALTIANSTLSGNQAKQHGGGLYHYDYDDSFLSLYNVTLTGNTADSNHDNDGNGGGLFATSGSVVQVRNSLIAHNTDLSPLSPFAQPHDCSAALTSFGYNLLRIGAGCTGLTAGQNGDLVGTYFAPVNPLLGALAGNGGTTQTHALLADSPARDAGNPAGCADGLGGLLPTDQRGSLRLSAGRCDIGAFEYQADPAHQVFLPALWR